MSRRIERLLVQLMEKPLTASSRIGELRAPPPNETLPSICIVWVCVVGGGGGKGVVQTVSTSCEKHAVSRASDYATVLLSRTISSCCEFCSTECTTNRVAFDRL